MVVLGVTDMVQEFCAKIPLGKQFLERVQLDPLVQSRESNIPFDLGLSAFFFFYKFSSKFM